MKRIRCPECGIQTHLLQSARVKRHTRAGASATDCPGGGLLISGTPDTQAAAQAVLEAELRRVKKARLADAAFFVFLAGQGVDLLHVSEADIQVHLAAWLKKRRIKGETVKQILDAAQRLQDAIAKVEVK